MGQFLIATRVRAQFKKIYSIFKLIVMIFFLSFFIDGLFYHKEASARLRFYETQACDKVPG